MTTTTPTIRARVLHRLITAELIAQYDQAISTHAGRHTNTSPRQARVNLIVDLISDRAESGDPDALRWLEA